MSGRSPRLSVFVVAAATALGGTAASAADIAVPGAAVGPSYYPPPVPAIYNWSGFYVGGNVGGGLLQDKYTALPGNGLDTAGTQFEISDTNFIGGFQIGANYQFGPAVIGVEGSWDFSALSLTTLNAANLAPVPTTEKSQTNENWFATVAGRLGYAFNTVLVYAKGGAAWMQVDYTQYTLNAQKSNVVNSQQQLADTRFGFLVGGGVEYAMTEQLSARFEYDFLDFGSNDYSFNNLTFPPQTIIPTPVPAPTSTPVGPAPFSITSYVHLFTVGLNYRFN